VQLNLFYTMRTYFRAPDGSGTPNQDPVLLRGLHPTDRAGPCRSGLIGRGHARQILVFRQVAEVRSEEEASPRMWRATVNKNGIDDAPA